MKKLNGIERDDIVMPFHYQIYERRGVKWFIKDKGEPFYNGSSTPMQMENVAQQFGLTEWQVVVELFRINGGKSGYYLANFQSKKYYYCGLDWEDIRTTLRRLGIGREDPVDV